VPLRGAAGGLFSLQIPSAFCVSGFHWPQKLSMQEEKKLAGFQKNHKKKRILLFLSAFSASFPLSNEKK